MYLSSHTPTPIHAPCQRLSARTREILLFGYFNAEPEVMWACPCVYTHETNVTSLYLRFTTVLAAPTTLHPTRNLSPWPCLVPARSRIALRAQTPLPLSSELGLIVLVVRRQARDRDEVDTVPVTFGVGQVVTQVRPVDRDRLAYVDNTRAHLHQGLARMAPSILHQRHKVPGAASRSGQPRPISLLGRAGGPCHVRPVFLHRFAPQNALALT